MRLAGGIGAALAFGVEIPFADYDGMRKLALQERIERRENREKKQSPPERTPGEKQERSEPPLPSPQIEDVSRAVEYTARADVLSTLQIIEDRILHNDIAECRYAWLETWHGIREHAIELCTRRLSHIRALAVELDRCGNVLNSAQVHAFLERQEAILFVRRMSQRMTAAELAELCKEMNIEREEIRK